MIKRGLVDLIKEASRRPVSDRVPLANKRNVALLPNEVAPEEPNKMRPSGQRNKSRLSGTIVRSRPHAT